MKKWSIQKKVWFAIMVILLTVIIGAVVITYFLYDKLYLDKQIDLLLMQGEELAEVYSEHGTDSFFNERLNWSKQSLAANVLFTDDPMQLGSGAPFEPSSNENLITFEERQQLLEGETVVMVRSHPHFQQDILGVAIPLFQNGHLTGSIFLSMPLSEVHEPFLQVRTVLIVSLFLVVLIIIVTGNKVINHVVRPLNDMKEVAKTMAAGDFSKRIKDDDHGDELGQLAKSFNILSSSLEKVEENRREFLANVSHELRTPLSYMKGYAEAMEEGVIEQKKGLEIIQKEANRLERLVNDLLDLAQLEGDSYPLQCEPIAFAQLVTDVVETFELIARQKNIQINSQLDEDSIIYGDGDRLEQVIRNLLDNAIRYTPEHKAISLTLTSKDEFSELVISDEGIGIPEEDISAVTERFYRVHKARTREKGGTGLGLAIVSQIMKKHGGTFELSSKVGQGTSARITLKNI
ncbi:sensor histidine kinase [Halalkalibacter nanhaiisediminis]|uniref:histidine kinase n=1 Tax=Halalkalibacter nanhaiisediminis TaxID=688079 RepID=A0A562QKD4_9BACI|nr:HAMP domain-containing sensor histidine kinase [Halalkalibacter nanhaiisediminis]TWI57222.1 HAMP domain-containing protein [Halalkalibacter nanhaiisediminis]